LQTLGVNLHDPGKLADADHPAVWQIGDVGAADERHHVVLAMAGKRNVPHQHHFFIAVGFLEGAFQQRGRIGEVPGEEFVKRADHARGRVQQALARGIVAGIGDQGADRGFRLRARRTLRHALRR